jgi:FlaG/FlaF family flagellin (archaellin)
MKIRRNNTNQSAVSEIIGAIIMVAIAVAMAAIAFVYFMNMTNQNGATPSISFSPSVADKTIQVTTAELNMNWIDINITLKNGTSHFYITKTGPINAGDIISLSTQPLRGKLDVTLIYKPTNSLLGTYTFDNV